MTTQNLTSAELDTIVTRVQKLLALSQSSNEHEAALAAARAQDLLFKYNLDIATIEGAGSPHMPYASHRVDLGAGKAVEWKRDLMFTLAHYNFCKAVSWRGSKAMSVIGQRHNYEVVMGLYDYLTKAFTRMVETALTRYRMAGGTDHSMSYKSSWLLGAANGVRAQLRAQQTANASTEAGSALVVVKDAELEEAMTNLIGKTTKHPDQHGTSQAGMLAGYQAGKTIGLHRQVNDGTAQGAKALS